MDLIYVIVQKIMVVMWFSERFKGAKQYHGLVFVITVMVFKLLNAGIMQILKQNNSCVITKGYKL